MEGSYDPVFSGPSTPISPGAPSGANQYKANVNRTKTRKWVEAKTIDYGGDDWGGNDYDEEEPIEPDEPEPPLPPPPKPRSPRSSATFSNSRPASPAGPRPPPTTAHAPAAAPSVSASPGLRTPAGAPALHIQTQQHPAAQQIKTDSGSPWRQGPPSRGSTPGTDRPREISPHAVGVPQSAATSSVYSAVSEFGQLYGDRSASPSAFQGPRARRMSPGPQSASSPVPTRSPGRKSSVGQHDAPADNIYPAIHADSNQQMASRPESGHANTGAIMSPYKPWMAEGTARGPRSASPSGSTRSSNATGKPLPFVRPADIYKKLEDEKEKVRRSMDSERPSVDSLGLGRASDTASSLRTQSPTRTSRSIPRTQEQGQVRPDSDVISPGFTQTMDAPFPEEVRAERMGTSPGHDNDDSAVPRGSRTGLPTVAERKSEYGVEGLLASYEARGGTSGGTPRHKASPLVTAAESTSAPASREGVPAISPATSRLPPRSEIVGDQVGHDHHVRELPDLQKKEGAARDEALGSAHSQERGVEEVQKGEGKALEDGKNEQPGEELRQSSTSPKLPELGRLSVFGVDLFSSSSSNPPASSSSFNHPTSSPPPPLPAIPSSHAIASPNPPLSTLVESPSPSSTLPQQDDHVDEEIQGQASADRPRSGVDSRPQFPAATDTIPRQDNASRIAATSERLPEPSILRQSEPTPAEHHSSSGDSTPDSRPVSARQAGAAEESAKRPATHTPGLKDFSTAPSTVTSKSESGQQPSVDKALPAVPSEASVVTPDPQTSQLATSAPTANVSDEPRPSEEKSPNDSSTKDTKLTAHPLLAERSEQAKAVSPHASPSGSSHAATASVLSPAPAPELTPVDNQVLSPDAEPSVHEEKLVEGDGAADTSDMEISPSQPSGAPPASPVEITGGETYVSARESPSLLGDGGSPTKTDKLSAEILRSLSPASPSPATAAESSDAATRSLDGPSSAARESSFLPDLYDDYWSFAGAGNATDADAPPVPTNPMATAMPAALNVQTENIRPGLNVQTENIRPGSLVAAGDENIHRIAPSSPINATPRSSADVFKTDVQAMPVEPHRPALQNRFSWEADESEAAMVENEMEPKSRPEQQETSAPVGMSPEQNTTAAIRSAGSGVEQPRTPSPTPSFKNKSKGSPVPANSSASPTLALPPSREAMPPTTSDAVPASMARRFSAHAGPLSSNPVMNWGEIMQMSSQSERILAFNTARTHYATNNSGLDTILENYATGHPDIVAANIAGGPTAAVYTYDIPSAQDVGGLLSPTAVGTTAIPRHYSHPTAHLGPKTKEFFATAGKASKGLFSTLKAKGRKVAN